MLEGSLTYMDRRLPRGAGRVVGKFPAVILISLAPSRIDRLVVPADATSARR